MTSHFFKFNSQIILYCMQIKLFVIETTLIVKLEQI